MHEASKVDQTLGHLRQARKEYRAFEANAQRYGGTNEAIKNGSRLQFESTKALEIIISHDLSAALARQIQAVAPELETPNKLKQVSLEERARIISVEASEISQAFNMSKEAATKYLNEVWDKSWDDLQYPLDAQQLGEILSEAVQRSISRMPEARSTSGRIEKKRHKRRIRADVERATLAVGLVVVNLRQRANFKYSVVLACAALAA